MDRALQLVAELAAAREGLRLNELAGRLGLQKQTAQGLLRTLEAWGAVAQMERGAPYVLGPRLLDWAQQWLGVDGHAGPARPHVEALNRKIGEYVLLAELRGNRLYRLVELDATQAVMVRPGWSDPRHVHALATGKVLLAYLEDEARGAVLDTLELAPLGPRAITDRAALEKQLDQVRRQGVAAAVEETGSHVAAVAVPVRLAGGAVHAALGTYLPTSRFTPARRQELVAALRETAAQIEASWQG